MIFEEVKTRTKPSIKVSDDAGAFYLHSKYDPLIEAGKWVRGIESKIIGVNDLVVVGMGAGYHIRQLLQKDNIKKVVVFDFNQEFSCWVLNSGLIDDLITDERVEYNSVNENSDLKKFTSYINENILIHQQSLKIFSEKFLQIRSKLENYLIQERTIIDQKDGLFKNFEKNIKLKDPGINHFVKSQEKPMILISAGPSLSKQLPKLKDASSSNKYTIGAVGTAFIPLLKFGITPDFVMISDPKDQIVEQFQGYNTKHTTLFYLSTANHLAVSKFNGPRFIVWQSGFRLAETEALQRNEPLIKTGGSVATCLLDLMVILGAKKIALIGQDLAFTDWKTHAEYIPAQCEVQTSAFLIEVPNYYQNGIVYTVRNLVVYLEWFKRYVVGREKIEFWNCTEGGAFIDGWIHEPFSKFLQK